MITEQQWIKNQNILQDEFELVDTYTEEFKEGYTSYGDAGEHELRKKYDAPGVLFTDNIFSDKLRFTADINKIVSWRRAGANAYMAGVDMSSTIEYEIKVYNRKT